MAEIKSTTAEAILKIEVDNANAIEQIGAYQKAIAESAAKVRDLKQAQEDGAITEAEATKQINAETIAQKALKKQLNQVEYQVQKNIQKQTEAEGSLKAMRGELSNLTAQFDNLSAAERNGAVGKKLQSDIAIVYNNIKKAEEETGRFQRNVGNYSQQMVTGFQATAGAAKGVVPAIGNVKTGVMALKTAGGWVGLVAGILAKIIQGMQGNEKAMNAVKVALAPLSAVGVMFNKVLEKMTDWLGQVVKNLGKYAKQLGLVSEAMEAEQKLTQKEIQQQEMRRKVMVHNAKYEKEISELRVKAAEKDKYTAAQRIEFLEAAAERERIIAEDNMTLAKNEFELAKERAARSANSREDNDRLAELEAAAIQAETDYYNRKREITTALVKARKELGATVAKGIGEAAADGWAEGFRQSFDKALAESEKKFEQALKESAENNDFSALEEIWAQDQAEIDAWFEHEAQVLAADDAMREYYAQKDKEREEQKVAVRKATAGAIGDTLDSLGKIAEQYADQDEAMAKASKILALAKIAIQTGVATAEGIAQSQDVPFPGNIAAMATTLAAIASGVASAVATVKSAKFATGGLVTGPGSGTSDSVPAQLSNGESVITARATSMFAPLLSTLNQIGGGKAINAPTGNGGTAMLEQAIARGMRAAQLSVSVTEIDTVRGRLENISAVANV